MFAVISQTVSRAIIGTVGTTLCAGLCLFAAAAPAAAANADAPRAITVGYSDLNLSTTQGRTALSFRVHSAARSVCTTGSNDIASLAAETRCVRNAVKGAQSKMIAAAADYQG